MKKQGKNIGASVRARLLNLARERGEEFQLVLTRYANERILYRLSQSKHERNFILKGAALFTVWREDPHRATRDLDLLGFGEPSASHIADIFSEIIALEVEDDGVTFKSDSLTASPIRGSDGYGGIRVLLDAKIDSAKLRVQIDIGFGDTVVPKPKTETFPPLLDLPAPRLRIYPRETVVAEKLEALVKLALANSRMKDFYDLMILPQRYGFDGELLVQAIGATFERRGTAIPSELPPALTPAFSQDKMKNTQWKAFLRKSHATSSESLAESTVAIARFVQPPLAAITSGSTFNQYWPPDGPWSPK